jgi:endonuclease/exonuclease/phosphatase family metal-dependent hydrolase
MTPHVRVITFNAAAGNPRITTPQERFLALPFYREAFAGGPDAPILALQEVGDVQSKALRDAHGTAVVLQKRRPGLGNALVIPDRYDVVEHGSGYYVLPQLRGIAHALRAGHGNWRQYGELRMWIQARLRDTVAGRELTVLTTHVSPDGDVKVPQLEAAVRRAERAGPPVVLAGDLNVPRGSERGRDVLAARAIARLRDMGGPPPGREKIDYVLASGFEPVSSRHWMDVLEQRISDHAPEDDVLRYRSK